MLLEGEGVTKYFGGLAAIKDVSFYVKQREILGLIGPNGAGKTTLFNLISGVYRPDSGVIKFNGENIAGLKPHNICRKGISRTFQLVRPFPNMTVLKNVMIGALFGKGKAKSFKDARREAMELLELTGLSEMRDVPANSLTLVDRKSLELARALATNPELLLLDEVVAGLNPVETARAMALIKKIRDTGITVFMVEHIMKAVMGISDRIIVLTYGQKIAEGAPQEVSKDRVVINAYLGEAYA